MRHDDARRAESLSPSSRERDPSRRRFLESLFTGALIGATAPTLLKAALVPRIVVTDTAIGGIYTVDLNDVPVLQTIGGSIRLVISEIAFNFRVIITRISEDHFEAVNARCPHTGQRVKARVAGEDFLRCEAHDSHFQFDGTYISGPADGQNLTRYTTTFDGVSILEIDIPQLTDAPILAGGASSIAIHSSGPIAGQIVFALTLDRPTSYTLSFWSIDGDEAIPPLSESREAGEHMIACDLTALPSGLYLYRLSTPDGVIGSGTIPVRR